MKKIIFFSFFLLLLFYFSPAFSQGGGMGPFMGTNFLRNDPVECLNAVGYAREYHSWEVTERCTPLGNGMTGQFPECNAARTFNNGTNKYYFNPSSGNATTNSFDAFYGQISIPHYPAAVGSIPDVGIQNCGANASNPFDRVPVYPLNSPLTEDPQSYAWHADFCTQYVNKYGNGTGPAAAAANLKLGEPGTDSPSPGLFNLEYFENYNEHDKWWENCNTPHQFTPEAYAAMSSADYDGHGLPNSADAVMAPNSAGGNYQVGIKNSDSSVKFVMSGMSNYAPADVDYVLDVNQWMANNRPNGDFVFDVINFHHYSHSDASTGAAENFRAVHGISPEEDGIYDRMVAVGGQLGGLGSELWLTEFGYDTHPFSDYNALPDVEVNGLALRDIEPFSWNDPNGVSYSENILTYKKRWIGQGGQLTQGEKEEIYTVLEETQGQWIARTFLIAAATGWEKAFQYFLSDRSDNFGRWYDENGLVDPTLNPLGYRFEYSGLTRKFDQTPVNKKESYYYTRTLNTLLANHEVSQTMPNGLSIEKVDAGIADPTEYVSGYDFTHFTEAVNNPNCEERKIALLNFDMSSANNTDNILVLWSPTHCGIAPFNVEITLPVGSMSYIELLPGYPTGGPEIFPPDADMDMGTFTLTIPVDETPRLIFLSNEEAPMSCIMPQNIQSNCNSINFQIDAEGQNFIEYAIYAAPSLHQDPLNQNSPILPCQDLNNEDFSYQVVNHVEEIQNFTINGLVENESYDIWIIGIRDDNVPIISCDGNCFQWMTETASEEFIPCGLPVFPAISDDAVLTYATDYDGNILNWVNTNTPAEVTMLPQLLFPEELFDVAGNINPTNSCNNYVGVIYDGLNGFQWFDPDLVDVNNNGPEPSYLQPMYIDLQDCFQINQIDLYDGEGAGEFQIDYTAAQTISSTTNWTPLFDPHYYTSVLNMWDYLQVDGIVSARYLRIWPRSNSGIQDEFIQPAIGEMRICGVLDAGFTTEIVEGECLTLAFTPDYQCGIATHEWIIEGVTYTSDNDAPIEHTFSEAGVFDVEHILTHTYDDGTSNSYTITQTITVEGEAEYDATISDITEDDCNQRTFESTITGVTHVWEVTGGEIMEPPVQNDNNIFEFDFTPYSGGTYIVSHTIISSGDCGNSTETLEVTILEINTETDIVIVEQNCIDGLNIVTFTTDPVLPSSEYTYNWTFVGGNTTTSDEQSPTIQYAAAGNHLVNLAISHECLENDVLFSLNITLDDCTPPEIGDCCNEGSMAIIGNVTLTEAISQGLLASVEDSPSSNQNIYIDGTLTIDANDDGDYNLNSSDVCLAPGARIEINPGVTFNLSNTHFHGCDEMWQGLVLGDEANVFATGCLFEDAAAAIQTNKDNALSLRSNTFRKNVIGIEQTFVSGGSTLNMLLFISNDFNCTDEDLLPAFENQQGQYDSSTSFCGISLTNASFFIPDNISFSSANRMSDMANGIISNGSTVTLRGIIYENMAATEDYEPSGFGVNARGDEGGSSIRGYGFGTNSPVTFNDCDTGIFSQGMNIKIENNRMTNVPTGIRMELGFDRVHEVANNRIVASQFGIVMNQCDNASDIRLENNRISFDGNNPFKTGIRIDDMGLGQENNALITGNIIDVNAHTSVGIRLNAIGGYKIIDNTVNLGTSGQVIGIAISGGEEEEGTTYQCNTVNGNTNSYQLGMTVLSSMNNTFLDNHLLSPNIGVKFSGACTQTRFATTLFSNNATGLLLTNSALFGEATIIGDQVHMGNRWIGDFANVGAWHQSTSQFNTLLSQFIVHTGPGTEYYPEIIANSGASWFVPMSGVPLAPGNCDFGLVSNPDKEITALDREIAKENAEVDIFSTEVLWTAQKELYRRLDKDPTLIGDDVDLQSFYDTKSTGIIGQLSNIDKESKFMNIIDSSIKGQITSLNTLIENHKNQLEILGQSLPALPTKEELLDLKAAQALIYTEINDAKSQLKILYSDIKNGKEVEAEIIKDTNSSISVTEVYEENEKIVNDIYLQTIARMNTDFTTTQASQLWLIATQCPLSGGNSVFKARSLYLLIDPLALFGDDAELCNAEGIILSQTPDDNGTVDAIRDTGLNDTGINSSETTNETSVKAESFRFTVLPNPASSKITVSYNELSNPSDYKVYLYNSVGMLVISEICNSPLSTKLNVSNLPEGIYWLNFIGSGNINISEKVLITR